MLYYRFLFLVACCLVGVVAQGQSLFEGRIELEQTTVTGVKCKVIWFVKKDRVAYQIQSIDGGSKDFMRFVPLEASKDVLVVMNKQRQRIKADELVYKMPYDLSGFSKKQLRTRNAYSNNSTNVWLLKTKGASVEAHIREDLDINLSKWMHLIQGDFGLLLVAKAGEKGFPVNYTVRDNSGNLISESKLLQIVREKVSDLYFN